MHTCSNDKNIHVNAYKTKKSRLELYLHRTKWSRKPFVCQTPFRLSQRFSSVFLWKDMCNVTTRKSTAKKCSCTNVTEWNGKLAALFAHKTIKLDSSWRTFLAFLTRIWLSLHVRYTKRTLSLLYRALKIHVLRLKIIPPTPLLIRTIFKVLSSNSSFTLPFRITVMNSLHYVTLLCVWRTGSYYFFLCLPKMTKLWIAYDSDF